MRQFFAWAAAIALLWTPALPADDDWKDGNNRWEKGHKRSEKEKSP